jgi:hypothetical protein
MADSETEFIMYHYNPSLVTATITCALFGISSILHSYQMIRIRAMYMIPMLIGNLLETVGFGARIGSAVEAPNFTLAPYIIQAILILSLRLFSRRRCT